MLVCGHVPSAGVCCRSATTAEVVVVVTERRALSQLRRKRLTKVCVRVPCSSHTLYQAEPGYLGRKTPQNVEIAL